MPSLMLGHAKLYYTASGLASATSHPPLVLVHGAGGTHMHWPAALRRLPGQAVYALDLPGHGASSGSAAPSIVDSAVVVLQWLAGLALPPCVLAGHSMGGAIALECALREPERLAGLVLVGTGGRLRVAPQLLEGLATRFVETATWLAGSAYGGQIDPGQLEQYVRQMRRVGAAVTLADFTACDRFDRLADLTRITLPSLVICGSADRMTPLKYSQHLAQALPNARLAVVEGAGHMVMLERPAQVAGLIADFIDAIPIGGR